MRVGLLNRARLGERWIRVHLAARLRAAAQHLDPAIAVTEVIPSAREPVREDAWPE